MKLLNKYTGLLCAVLMSTLLLASCGKDGGPTDPDPENPDRPGNTIDADKLSEYLVLTDATKITGPLPTVPDNQQKMNAQLKINFKDSIFVMKGFPYGARMAVLHEGSFDIAGFYVGVAGSSFYYDVPVVEAEAQDSTDVFYINMEIPESDDVEYPFSVPIKILPYGLDFIPLDEFEKEITSEDPENTDCPITMPVPPGSNVDEFWVWEYTLGFDDNGELFHLEAPRLEQVSRYQTGGCCNEDGSSTTVANDPYCFANFSDGTSNPRWRTIDVEHYFRWGYDLILFFDDGTFRQQNISSQSNYIPSQSDFCNKQAAYDYQGDIFIKTGTHDFTPGTDYLTITYDVENPPVYGKTIRSGKIEYTCHLIVLIYEVEGQRWEVVFRKQPGYADEALTPSDYYWD